MIVFLLFHPVYQIKKNIHMAITDDNDEYMGTVSLKNINYIDSFAEFAITVRRTAMGKKFRFIWYE